MLTDLYSTIPALALRLPLHICTIGRFNGLFGPVLSSSGQGFIGSGWPAINRAIYTPMHMPASFTVARFMVPSTNTTGNVDIGIYDNAGNRLLSTGTVAKNTAAVMYFDVTNTRFPAGHYYLACVGSSTSGGVSRVTVQDQYSARMCGLLQEALGSTVLPTTMTPAAYASNLVFHYGFTQSDSL